MLLTVDLGTPSEVAKAIALLKSISPSATPHTVEATKQPEPTNELPLRDVLKSLVAETVTRLGKERSGDIKSAMEGNTVGTVPEDALSRVIEAVKRII